MNRLAIVVRDDAYDRILTPLTFAYTRRRPARRSTSSSCSGRCGADARRGRSPDGDPGHEADAAWLREKLAADGEPVEIADWLAMLATTGRVRFYGCRYAAQTFEVAPDDLIPEADGTSNPADFSGKRRCRPTTRNTSDPAPRGFGLPRQEKVRCRRKMSDLFQCPAAPSA